MSIFLRAESIQKLYRRTDYEILTYLGDLGGLIDVVVIFFYFLAQPFVRRIFQAQLVSKAYRLQKLMLDQEPYYETHTKGVVTPPSSSDDSDSKKSSSDASSDSSDEKYVKPETKVKKAAVQGKRHTIALGSTPAGLSLFEPDQVVA